VDPEDIDMTDVAVFVVVVEFILFVLLVAVPSIVEDMDIMLRDVLLKLLPLLYGKSSTICIIVDD
jgi:hypothetical protein